MRRRKQLHSSVIQKWQLRGRNAFLHLWESNQIVLPPASDDLWDIPRFISFLPITFVLLSEEKRAAVDALLLLLECEDEDEAEVGCTDCCRECDGCCCCCNCWLRRRCCCDEFNWALLGSVGCLIFGRNPLLGYNGYYRPAIRIQSRLRSLLLYQMPVGK